MCNGVIIFAKNRHKTLGLKDKVGTALRAVHAYFLQKQRARIPSARYWTARSAVPTLCGWIATLCLLAAACSAFAEPVKIEFLPPPMEGTLSLGIYDDTGELVRILHQEIEPSELTPGDDGLITHWDGKDDQGKSCPPGTYRLRGVMVGDLGVEGVGFIGNDWVTQDDAPRVRQVTDMVINEEKALVIAAKIQGEESPAYYATSLKPGTDPAAEFEVQLAAVPKPVLPAPAPPMWLPKNAPTWTIGGIPSASIWAIEGTAVTHYTNTGKPLAPLVLQPNDPPPVQLAASESHLYVLYENATLQRLRGYDFTGVKPGDAPKVLFENDIRASDTYEQIASELKFPDEKPFVPSPLLTVELVPNPLAHNKPGTLQIKANINRAGCFLETADGLPLCHISDTKYLRWAVMGRPAGSKAITVFDSDGAVVEQFQISKIANMMAFDAGVIQWPAEAATPSSSPSSTPAAGPSPAPTPVASPKPSPSVTPLSSPASTATPAANSSASPTVPPSPSPKIRQLFPAAGMTIRAQRQS